MTSPKHVMARSATIDCQDGFLTIDDVQLPWWLARVDPEINHDGGVTELTVTFLVDGSVTLISEFGKRRQYDTELGAVGEWAREYVRTELQRAFPDLVLS